MKKGGTDSVPPFFMLSINFPISLLSRLTFSADPD